MVLHGISWTHIKRFIPRGVLIAFELCVYDRVVGKPYSPVFLASEHLKASLREDNECSLGLCSDRKYITRRTLRV